MPTLDPTTTDDLVAHLGRSSLPTVLVEGKDDRRIYRWVEGRLGSRKANVHFVDGKENLLSVYQRRSEFSHLPVAFVADKDMWLFSGQFKEYSDIIWTIGYSIENDLYAGAELENLLEQKEEEGHRQLLDTIIEWFTFEVEKYLAGEHFEVAHHCDRVVPRGRTQIDEEFRKSRNYRPPGEALCRQIRETYQLQLRGKQLFQVLVRFLSAPNRKSKYSYLNLQEIAFQMTPSHPLMSRLIKEIEQTIADQNPAFRHDNASQ